MPRRSLGRASLVLLGSTWIYSGLSLVISVLIGRVLGPATVGELALNLGLAGVVMAALLPGFTQAHLKRLAEGQDPGRCVGTMAAIQLALAAALAVVVVVAWRTGTLAGVSSGTVVFVAMLGAQVASRLADVFLKVFIAREWVVLHGAVLLGARVARLAATGLVLLLAPRVSWVALTFLLESALTCAAAVVVLVTLGIRPRRPTRSSVADYWRYARPFLVTTPLALVQDSIDRVLVGRWAGLTAAGYYHVARGLWEALAGVMAPPGLLLFTRLSSLYAERTAARDEKARRLFFSGLDKLLFVATALAVAFWALAEPLLATLYGPSFVPATTTLRILVVAALAATVVNPYTFVLQAQDEVARFIPLNAGRFVMYLAALAVLVPGLIPGLPAGDAGAAVARLLLTIVPAWVWVGWTRDLAGIPFYRRATIYLGGFALAAVSFHLCAALLGAPPGPPLPEAAIAGAVAFAVYAVWLVKLHPDARANLAYALGLLTPGADRRAG